MKTIAASIALLVLAPLFAAAQTQTVVKGIITDATTKEPLPFVNVFFTGHDLGVVTDLNGKYLLTTDQPYTALQFSFIGYKTIFKKIMPGEENILNIRLAQETKVLKELVITSGKSKEKYRNKNNPAVDLVREMIAHKKQNQIGHYDYTESESYEKLQISISNPSNKFRNRKIFKRYKFLFDNVDTTSIPGKALLPVYLQENIIQDYTKKEPERKKSVTLANKKVSFEEYIDDQGVTTYLNFLYNNINIYDNNITLLTNQFLSPIADLAPAFYKFYITDTIRNHNPALIELAFVPRNQAGFLFQGKLYVTMDGNYAVQKLDMTVNKHVSLNWVRELFIRQEFEPASDHRYYLSKSQIRGDFGVSKSGGGIYGERLISRKNFMIDQPHDLPFYDEAQTLVEKNAAQQNESFWLEHRHDSLSGAESKVYQNVDSLKKMPSFRRTMDLATLALAGYKGFGKFEIGPANTFYSFNPVEGFRLRVGGRTTPKFNDHLYFETYAAYGFKDEKWKYYLGSTYSFTGRSIWRFPVKTLKVSFQHDTKIPGQELQFIQEDNFLLSFKRGINDKWLYNDILNIDYLHEFENHFSYKLGFKSWRQTAAGGLVFAVSDGDKSEVIENLSTSEFSAEFRWAPREQFYQGKIYRVPIPNKYPIATLRLAGGLKGFLNGEYNYQSATLNIFKRVYLSQLGYSDITVEGSYIFGKLPFPLLAIHRANQTYSYQLQSYNLMNFLEFVSDHYASINIDHCFNGFFFNHLPLIKNLKWREIVTAKILYGGLRYENKPSDDKQTFVFPTDAQGRTSTYSLSNQPYVEGSVGIANIFKVFRVDFVKRFTYLDHPNISPWGIRGRFKLDF